MRYSGSAKSKFITFAFYGIFRSPSLYRSNLSRIVKFAYDWCRIYSAYRKNPINRPPRLNARAFKMVAKFSLSSVLVLYIVYSITSRSFLILHIFRDVFEKNLY